MAGCPLVQVSYHLLLHSSDQLVEPNRIICILFALWLHIDTRISIHMSTSTRSSELSSSVGYYRVTHNLEFCYYEAVPPFLSVPSLFCVQFKKFRRIWSDYVLFNSLRNSIWYCQCVCIEYLSGQTYFAVYSANTILLSRTCIHIQSCRLQNACSRFEEFSSWSLAPMLQNQFSDYCVASLSKWTYS